MQEIEASCKKHKDSPNQVFLSFLTDPYSHFNNETKLTRRVLELLYKYRIPVSILSKGGMNIMQDLDIIKRFGNNIQVGASLTFTKDEDCLKWEKNSTLPAERFETLELLHSYGIRTWASMEPVIIPDQSLEIMEITKGYIDFYKVGKLNHFPKYESKFDWPKFLRDTVAILRKNKKDFYIKEDLRRHQPNDLILTPQEIDMDYGAIKNQFQKAKLFE